MELLITLIAYAFFTFVTVVLVTGAVMLMSELIEG